MRSLPSLEISDLERSTNIFNAVKYFSQATSTFIVRTSRTHHRLVWAALTFMNSLPVKNGRSCIFRVVRVSGTIRKVEEDAIRRAKRLILAAREQMAAKSSSSLDALFVRPNEAREVALGEEPAEQGKGEAVNVQA